MTNRTARCKLCGKELSEAKVVDDLKPGETVRSLDCGGDCLECMARGGDPECQALMEQALVDEFWKKFIWLVRDALDQVEPDREEDLRVRLQDSTSCYHPGIPERGEKRS